MREKTRKKKDKKKGKLSYGKEGKLRRKKTINKNENIEKDEVRYSTHVQSKRKKRRERENWIKGEREGEQGSKEVKRGKKKKTRRKQQQKNIKGKEGKDNDRRNEKEKKKEKNKYQREKGKEEIERGNNRKIVW